MPSVLCARLVTGFLFLLLAFCAKADECSDAKAQLAALQKKLDNTTNLLSTQTCAGSARLECIQGISALHQSLNEQGQYVKVVCAPTSVKNEYPRYIVLSIIYAPPGNHGSVVYESGSSTGTSIESTDSNIDGAQGQVSSVVSNWTVTYTNETTIGSTTEVKKSESYPITLESTKDEIDHDQDKFYLWVNPQLTLKFVNELLSGYTLEVTTGQDLLVVDLNARELKDPGSIPAYKKAMLTKLLPSDYADILAKNPFASGANTFDKKRFYKIDNLQIRGPDAPGDYPSGNGIHESSEVVNGQIIETKETVQFAVLFGFTFANIGIMGGLVEGWESDNKREMTYGSSQDITVNAETDTVGYHKSYDVYLDTIFNSFVFLPLVDASDVVSFPGVAKLRNGKPARNKLIIVTGPNGQSTKLMSDAKGNYRFYGSRSIEWMVRTNGRAQRLAPKRAAG